MGDIHGMFSALEDMLDQINFDESCDRLFSLGDLIDRGGESHRALEFLDKPWFHAIMGNHEKMLLDAEHDIDLKKTWTRYNGGDWWTDIDEDKQAEFREKLEQLPIAIEIQSCQGKIGLLHADITPGYTWKYFIAALDDYPDLRENALWSRARYRHYVNSGKTQKVDGLDLLIFGHTPVEYPVIVENLCYLDTGAPYTHMKKLAKLSMLEVNPDLKLHQISTLKKKSWNNWLNQS